MTTANVDYSPFPESELEALAKWHSDAAALWPERTFLRHVHEERATVCREAIKNHVALRERCLIAEMELGQMRAAS